MTELEQLKEERKRINARIKELTCPKVDIGTEFKIIRHPVPAWSESLYHVRIRKLSDCMQDQDARYITIIETENIDTILGKLKTIKTNIDSVITYFENLTAPAEDK